MSLEYQSGVRKAKKTIHRYEKIPLRKARESLYKRNFHRYLEKMFLAVKESRSKDAEFAKGMAMAYGYFLQFGLYLDERLPL